MGLKGWIAVFVRHTIARRGRTETLDAWIRCLLVRGLCR